MISTKQEQSTKSRNPDYDVIKALSHFFGVSPNDFFESDQPAEAWADETARSNRAARFRDASVEKIALRASDLDEAGRGPY